MPYAVIGLVVLMIVFVIWLSVSNRKAGAAAEQAKVATKTADTLQAQDKAGAAAPHSTEATIDALDKGTF